MTTYVQLSEYGGTLPPAVSPAGRSRVYFDSVALALFHSDNGGAYVQFGPAFGAADVSTTGNLLLGADPADTGRIRLSNADTIAWEASPTGTDVVGISVNATEQLLLGVAGNLPTATILDVQTAGSYTLRVNNVDEYVFDAASLNLGDNLLIQGATPATAGDYRVKQTWSLRGRNSINTLNQRIIEYGVLAADIVEVGDGGAGTRIYSNATIRTYIVATERFRIGSVSIDINNGTTANYSIQGNAESMIGLNIGAAGVRNIAFFNDGSAGMNSMDGGLFQLTAVAAPTGNPTGGFYHWGSGGTPAWRTAAGDILILSLVSAAGATAGAGVATPATVREFITATYNGTVVKLAVYDN